MYSKVEGGENMLINKELTNKYYENYSPCNCGYCKYFIKHIENEQPMFSIQEDILNKMEIKR